MREVKEKADCSDNQKDASQVTWLLDPYETCRKVEGINLVIGDFFSPKPHLDSSLARNHMRKFLLAFLFGWWVFCLFV